MERGHGIADEALRELVRGYSSYDLEEGPSSSLPSLDSRLVSLPKRDEIRDVCFWLAVS